MNDTTTVDANTVRQKLNHDTAKIGWSALDEHHQEGSVIYVSSELDLIDVAYEFTQDNSDLVRTWLAQIKIGKVSDSQAQNWKDEEFEIWAVVVAPWVLVQDDKPEKP